MFAPLALVAAAFGAVGCESNSLGDSYKHGFEPTTITDTDADAAYDLWKNRWVEDCGDGVFRVMWSTASLTVSEGIGYGMLLSVIHDDQQLFDGLWRYYQNNVDDLGLMHWQRSGCQGDTAGNGAASDADLDAAMALVMASHRWGKEPYETDARMLITKIHDLEIAPGSDGLLLLKPGDMFGGMACLNFSYFAPGYYRMFARVVPEQAEVWNKLADDTYTLIERVAHPTTGLVPNWCDEDGASAPAGPSGCPYYTNADQYGADAARTPWRIATDYVWWGTPRAKQYLDKVTTWVKGVGIANIGNRYQLDGTVLSTGHSIVTVGAFADGALSYDQPTADEFFAEVVGMDLPTGYFSMTLRALYMLLPVGRFTPNAGL